MKTNPSPWNLRPLGIIGICLLAPLAHAAEKSFQYFRFTPTQLRNVPGQSNSIQLSEFQFKLGANVLPMTGVTVSNPGGSNPGSGNENPNRVADGQIGTKWLDFNKQSLVFNFGSTVTIDGYNFATANDAPERDPVSWTLSGSPDGTNWTLLDVITNHPTTTTRQVYESSFVIPENLDPLIEQFVGSPVVILNGQSTSLLYNVELADTVTIDGIGTVPSSGSSSVSPPDNSDTDYFLDASTAFGFSSATTTVRTVTGGASTYRYVRFIPLKLRNGPAANSIQLSDFYFRNGVSFITPTSVTNPGGNTPGNEGPANLIDSNPLTKWLDFNKSGLVFDFGSSVTFDQYSFTTANDAIERDPVRWSLEGSNDLTTWTLIENFNQFDYPVTTARRADIQDIPLPGTSLIPVIDVSAGNTQVVIGEKATLNILSMGATTVTITQPDLGVIPNNGPYRVTITEDTFFEITATGASGATVTDTILITAVDLGIDDIAYQDFTGSGNELSFIGNASVVTDPTRPLPAEVPRLRLTNDTGSVNGSAWFKRPQLVADGFESNFNIHLTTTNGPDSGADGMAFVLQNQPAGPLASPTGDHERGLSSNALNICFDSYQNADQGDASNALLSVRAGTTVLTSINLAANPAFTFGGVNSDDLTTGLDSAPYAVRVTYIPGDLDVYFNNILVVDSLNVNLETIGAVDEDGKAFAGFTSRTGGLFEAHDVTRWFLTEGAPAAPPAQLTLLSSSLDLENNQITLTWSSSDTKSYRVVASQDLSDWTTVLQNNIPGAPGSNQTTIIATFTPATKLFFRVEEIP
jgi:hypothetical protein